MSGEEMVRASRAAWEAYRKVRGQYVMEGRDDHESSPEFQAWERKMAELRTTFGPEEAYRLLQSVPYDPA